MLREFFISHSAQLKFVCAFIEVVGVAVFTYGAKVVPHNVFAMSGGVIVAFVGALVWFVSLRIDRQPKRHRTENSTSEKLTQPDTKELRKSFIHALMSGFSFVSSFILLLSAAPASDVWRVFFIVVLCIQGAFVVYTYVSLWKVTHKSIEKH
jgi:hypothetical protein